MSIKYTPLTFEISVSFSVANCTAYPMKSGFVHSTPDIQMSEGPCTIQHFDQKSSAQNDCRTHPYPHVSRGSVTDTLDR